MVGLGGDAQAQLQVGGILVLHHRLAREVRRQERASPLVGCREMIPAHGLGNAGYAQTGVAVLLPQRQLTTQQRCGIGHVQFLILRCHVARQDHRSRTQHGGQRVRTCSLHRLSSGILHSYPTNAEQAHKVGLHQTEHGINRHRVYKRFNAVTSVIIRNAVLRNGYRLHAGTVAQAFGYLQQGIHIVLRRMAFFIEGGVGSQPVHRQVITMLRIEAHRCKVDTRRRTAPVHDVPQHHEDYQQLQRKEEVAAPFVPYLSK
ncbi:unknown [Bacteroides sp. CAG:633]|nr:unknown [Bacteroides sp. CAG:633]